MLFYPDQFFYSKGPQRDTRRSRHRHHGGARYARDASDDEDVPQWFGPLRGPQVQRQHIPDEYIVGDEDELNALRAFREAKRRTSQREQFERAQLARRKAEAERRARENARREAEARFQAQVEANARAATREYLRRQQARQQAILEAQQAERQRQQQFVMEQLRRQFGLFAVPTAPEPSDLEQQQQQQQQPRPENEEDLICQAVDEAQRQVEAEDAAAQQRPEGSRAGEAENTARSERQSEEPFDPIRSLIEALAPYPFIIATESSDEEEAQKAKDNSEVSDEDNTNDDEEEEDPTRSVEFVAEPDTTFGGPTCETASDDSEPVYVEEPDFRVLSATPPIPVEYDSSEDAPSLKDRRKERQTSAPVDHLKKAKTKEARKEAKKEAKRERKERRQSKDHEPKAQPAKQATSAEISGLLRALSDELKRLKDAYVRLSNAKPTDDLREVISRLEAVKIGYSRSEEIYNKLDEVRAGKDERKIKHEITTESVALAEKYEELLNRVYEEKKDVSARTSRSATPTGEKSAEAKTGNDPSPKHEVVLEEVQDESD